MRLGCLTSLLFFLEIWRQRWDFSWFFSDSLLLSLHKTQELSCITFETWVLWVVHSYLGCIGASQYINCNQDNQGQDFIAWRCSWVILFDLIKTWSKHPFPWGKILWPICFHYCYFLIFLLILPLLLLKISSRWIWIIRIIARWSWAKLLRDIFRFFLSILLIFPPHGRNQKLCIFCKVDWEVLFRSFEYLWVLKESTIVKELEVVINSVIFSLMSSKICRSIVEGR